MAAYCPLHGRKLLVAVGPTSSFFQTVHVAVVRVMAAADVGSGLQFRGGSPSTVSNVGILRLVCLTGACKSQVVVVCVSPAWKAARPAAALCRAVSRVWGRASYRRLEVNSSVHCVVGEVQMCRCLQWPSASVCDGATQSPSGVHPAFVHISSAALTAPSNSAAGMSVNLCNVLQAWQRILTATASVLAVVSAGASL